MFIRVHLWLILLLCALLACTTIARADALEDAFRSPPPSAKPRVFWYWMHAAVSREGITADLEAMKAAGIGGAYLAPIKPATTPPLFEPATHVLTPEWWALVKHAFNEADRLGLEIIMHASDGFATAGGPWITPELSMQKVVWSETLVDGGAHVERVLPAPPTEENFYRELTVVAVPMPDPAETDSLTRRPVVTTSQPEFDARFLAESFAPESKQRFRSEGPGWVAYTFAEPFTLRSLTISPGGNNAAAHRLRVEASDDDGKTFRAVASLAPPRHGWQDGDAGVTHAVPETTARVFRFSYDPAGAEPGAEDLDSAKWRPVLRIGGLTLSGAPRLHQFEGKSGAVWRVSPATTEAQVPPALAVPLARVVDLSAHVDATGKLTWDAPPGRWRVLRIGHTSTGHTNATAGAGIGLECDKLNPEVARLQFDRWFGEALRVAGPAQAGRVLKGFHVDSWEAGSQNWSPTLRAEFVKRRGYDPLPWLPAMAGVPLASAAESEKFLHDLRRTIAELVVDNFFKPLAALVHANGCEFTSETVAPTMLSDGLAHFDVVDVPMGEFWLRSPTHDKPNDMLDAISGARIYGKNIVQAEAFTQLRMAWDEHPAMLKALGDRNYALGANRLVYHVWAHNPWLDRRPGMTLDGVGLYFQRDQTWFRAGRAWVAYAQRAQALLQHGRPVVDVAVFTGEELPSRAVLPEKLVDVLPGVIGAERVEREHARLANVGQPQRELPRGVRASANISDPAAWVDPLRGYAYDSINRDALVRLAKVDDGRLVLSGSASYRVLVVPPTDVPVSDEFATALKAAAEGGVQVLPMAYARSAFDVAPDFIVTTPDGKPAAPLAWTHRASPGVDIYFVANPDDTPREVELSLRVAGRRPELWDAVTGEIRRARSWKNVNGRTVLPLRLEAAESVFIVLREATTLAGESLGVSHVAVAPVQTLDAPWRVTFDARNGGPAQPMEFGALSDWTTSADPAVKFFSGTAEYAQTFSWSASTPPADATAPKRVWLELGRVDNVAEVTVNGVACGVAWTAPYRVEITRALRAGSNELRIAVTNTWRNRILGDRALSEAERITRTTAPDRLGENAELLPAGLRGPVRLVTER